MILNSLKLKNIRSYSEEEIQFPHGSVMLSGDIGTGKTSILLSIEFALFGIIRGQLSGGSLLRHGAREGYVELDFSLDGKKIVLRRTLKRGAKSVTQDSGYIVIDGEKHDLTPVELKSKILELIGYPDELVTKSKSFIYRYTVYTPQEEMKHILFESKDDRLNVLRRIFDIDKYKRIKENTLGYIKDLKSKKTELETRSEDLDEKKKELSLYNGKIASLKKDASKVQSLIAEANKKVLSTEKKMNEFEQEMKALEKVKSEITLKSSELSSKKHKLESDAEEVKNLNESIADLSKDLEGVEKLEDEALKKKKTSIEEERDKLRENIEKINDRESTFKTKKSSSEEIISKIFSLAECPVCKQDVDDKHKNDVKKTEEAKVRYLDSQLLKLLELKSKRKEELEVLEKEFEKVSEHLSKHEVFKLKQDQLNKNLERKEAIMKEQLTLKSEIEDLAKEVTILKNKTEKSSEIQKAYTTAKNAWLDANQEVKKEEIKKAEFEREEKTIALVTGKLKEEIEKKEEAKTQLAKVQEVQNWLVKFFLNVIYLMEKQIMLHVHSEFNEYFQEWFNVLIEDENLNVRLDETFTPTIEQNGYETYIENLSGGERTSVALSYRLALNKVINDFIGTIKTKDLLILDEPTDGFSSEQLDKIRELLEQLRIKQIILVSHEPKLESYVDYIIRVHKEEHVSRVIA